jgi:hypothetical protein
MKTQNYQRPTQKLRNILVQHMGGMSHVATNAEGEEKTAGAYCTIYHSFLSNKGKAFTEACMALWQHPHLPIFNLDQLGRIHTHWKYHPEIITDILLLADKLDGFIGSKKFWTCFLAHYPCVAKAPNKAYALAMAGCFLKAEVMEDLSIIHIKVFYMFITGFFPLENRMTVKRRNMDKLPVQRNHAEATRWFIKVSTESREELTVLTESQYLLYLKTIMTYKRPKNRSVVDKEFRRWLSQHYSPALLVRFHLPMHASYPLTFYEVLQLIWDVHSKNMKERAFYVRLTGYHNVNWEALLLQVLGDFCIPLPFVQVLESLQGLSLHWFEHALRGKPLRRATGLPFALSAKTEHHLNEVAKRHPVKESRHLLKTFFLAELLSQGASEEMIAIINRSRMMLHFQTPSVQGALTILDRPDSNMEKMMEISKKVVRLKIPSAALPGVIDFLYAYEFEGENNLPWKGMTANSLIRRSAAWHQQFEAMNLRSASDVLYRNRKLPVLPIPPFEIKVAGKTFIIHQLLQWHEFQMESKELRHCVISYYRACAAGSSFIFSLKEQQGELFESRVTIEIRDGYIVQARGKCNRNINAQEKSILDTWVRQNAEYLTLRDVA